MVENGAVDGPIEARGEDEMLRYTVRSLVAFGKRTIAENPKLRTIKFVDMAGAFVVSDD
jgi:hypothetical protein